MAMFRLFLIALWLTLFGYTAIVITHHGFDLFPIFFGDIARMGWPGQFNLDFSFMLTLSALWVAWRHRFSASGMALATGAALGGASFLSVYLLIVSIQVKGDVRTLLLGPTRA